MFSAQSFRTSAENLPSPQSAQTDPPRRIIALDGIRGLAALMVLGYHAFYLPLIQTQTGGSTRLVAELAKAGWLGVDLFFVLSGFLITGILLDGKGGKHYFRNFYARRILRIVPLYYAALLILFLCYRGSGSFVLLGCFYLTNFASLFSVPMLFGPLWSLSVEEHFYLLWPGLVRFTSKRMLALIAAGIVIISPVARALAFGSVEVMDIYYFSFFRFDGLAWGALLALSFRSPWWNERNQRWVATACFGCGAAMIACGLPFGILSRERFTGTVLLYTAAQLVFAGMIAAALNARSTSLTKLLSRRLLTWCGDMSYCFYLVHVFCFHAWDWLLVRLGMNVEGMIGTLGNVALRALIGTILSFGIAALSWRYFESPVLRLKKHFAAEAHRTMPQSGIDDSPCVDKAA